jgi:hypothetical protein
MGSEHGLQALWGPGPVVSLCSPRGACGECALVAEVSEGNKGRRLSYWLCLKVFIWVHGWVVPARMWRW